MAFLTKVVVMTIDASDQASDTDTGDDRRYRAPALEKGLDILELLAGCATPLTLTQIVQRLGRSHGELFRMVQVLEYRGYLTSEAGGEGYSLSDRLFSLGMNQPRTRYLIEVALPEMRRLAQETGQSCHVAVHTMGDMAVVARMESAEQLGFSVRVGYRRPLLQAASGAVLYAFQPDDVRARWEKLLDPQPDAETLAAFRTHADEIRQRAVERTPSRFVSGVTDLSAPILRGGAAAAALTMPYLAKLGEPDAIDAAAAAVQAAAARISAQLVDDDHHP
ncbi:IclR family transcriptional regulator [Sphingomonas sp. SAFR-052]|uniref:IclR family transcriptional regulator n=1 Tax=Sphingomonas sp. SAFR-052 TaxID=3436867 RepID=UPI003F81D8DB